MFTVETFSKIGETVMASQKAFLALFMLRQNDAVSDSKSILLCVKNSVLSLLESEPESSIPFPMPLTICTSIGKKIERMIYKNRNK